MTAGVVIAASEWDDPRFSRPQRQAIEAAAEADPLATLLGLDYALRPVIYARLGVPRNWVMYAVLRNGDPTEPKLDRSAPAGLSSLMEPWGESEAKKEVVDNG